MSKPTYVITDYGVVADSDALQTQAVQKVLDMCRECGGTVIIPEGNHADLSEVDTAVKENTRFITARNLDTVIGNALTADPAVMR